VLGEGVELETVAVLRPILVMRVVIEGRKEGREGKIVSAKEGGKKEGREGWREGGRGGRIRQTHTSSIDADLPILQKPPTRPARELGEAADEEDVQGDGAWREGGREGGKERRRERMRGCVLKLSPIHSFRYVCFYAIFPLAR